MPLLAADTRAYTLVIGLLLACKREPAEDPALQAYVAKACACPDRACADAIVAEAVAWTDRQRDLSAAEVHAAVSTLTACQQQATARTPVPLPPAMPAGRPPPAALIASAFAHAQVVAPRLIVSTIETTHARADGTVGGELSIWFAIPSEDRRPLSNVCPVWVARDGAWHVEREACTVADPVPRPRCTLEEVWARAARDRNPPAPGALAQIRLIADPDTAAPVWAFTIEPETIANRFYPDDCPQ